MSIVNSPEIEVVAAVILNSNNEILCMQRGVNKYEYISEKYEFPGGKIKENEPLKEALKRELNEELSIDVNIIDIIEFPNNVLKTEKLILSVYIIKKWKNELIINHEINSEFLKVKKEELKNVEDLLETDKQLIPALLNFLN